MKYIIKNCPACYNYDGKYGCEDNHDEQGRDTYCENISDCSLKKIVDKCTDKANLCKNCMGNFLLNGCEKCPFDTKGLAQEILNLLEIEEVE